MTCGVYSIRNTANDKLYVGSSISIERRWVLHRWQLRTGRHPNSRLQGAWLRDGEAVFEFAVIQETEPADRLAAEQDHIVALQSADPRHGYNRCPVAGSTVGVPCRPETRERIGRANRGRKYGPEVLARKWAAMNRPEVKAKFRALSRSESSRARVSRSKGGTGKILTAEAARNAAASYQTGETSMRALARLHGVGYGQMRSVLTGGGAKSLRGAPAVSGREPEQIRRKISRTLVRVPREVWTEVQRLHDAGLARQHELSQRFGLSRPQINRIVHRKLACYAE